MRRKVEFEFAKTRLSKRDPTPTFDAAMNAYERELLRAVQTNAELLTRVFGPPNASMPNFSRQVWSRFRQQWLGEDVLPCYDRLGSSLRHLAKDWTTGGVAGRTELNSRVVQAVRVHLESLDVAAAPADETSNSQVRIVVPGCGQARLSWTLAHALPNVSVIGIDESAVQLAFAAHMMHAEPQSLTFHPFVDEPRNHHDPLSRTFAVSAPDVHAQAPSNLSLLQLSFQEWQRIEGRSSADVVVSCFFLDCLPDVPLAMQHIAHALKADGLFVFAGPLHYHHWPAASPAVSHLLMLCSELDLQLIAGPDIVPAPYASQPDPTIAHEYLWRVPFFVCQKRG